MMKLLVVALLLAVVLAHEGHSHDHDHADGESAVLVLDSTNFDEEIAAHDLMLVEFYAPWCGHCKSLAPEYESAATQLIGKAILAKVDCTTERELCNRFDVKGFPTLKVFRNDGSDPTDFTAARQASAIVSFLLKQSAPAFTELTTAEEVAALADKAEPTVVGFFSSSSDSEAAIFTTVAKSLRNDFDFVVVASSDIAAANGVTAPAVVMFKSFDERKAVMSADISAEAITAFVKSESFPLLGEIGPDNYQKYVDRALPIVWVFAEFEAKPEELFTTAAAVASDFKGQASFVKLDGVRWADHAKNFGLQSATPGIVIEDRSQQKNFIFPHSEITLENLKSFVQSFFDRTLQPHVKSQEIPADNSAPVKVVVGKSFETIVMDPSKDVFVEFYAPWCGHCKTLAPKWEMLAEEFAAHDSVVIAKVDATENDTPADIKGFPTLIFYPAHDKQNPINFSGDRSTASMAQFVRQHAKTLQGETPVATPDHDEL